MRFRQRKSLDPVQSSLSLGEIAVRSHRLMLDFLTRRPELSGLGDPTGAGQAFLQLTAKLIADPMSIAQAQLELWADHMKLWQRTTERLFDPTGASDQRPATTDRRFQHPAWTENILFDYIKQSYLISAEAIGMSLSLLKCHSRGLPPLRERRSSRKPSWSVVPTRMVGFHILADESSTGNAAAILAHNIYLRHSHTRRGPIGRQRPSGTTRRCHRATEVGSRASKPQPH